MSRISFYSTWNAPLSFIKFVNDYIKKTAISGGLVKGGNAPHGDTAEGDLNADNV